MQSDSKEIYKITSKRTGLPEQMYKDLGNFVQKQIVKELDLPKKLIIKIRGLGSFHLRRSRMQRIMGCYPVYYEIEGYKDFESERAFLQFIDKQAFYLNFKERLKDYDEFIRVKKETKQKRNEFEKLPESKKDSNQSSQNNT